MATAANLRIRVEEEEFVISRSAAALSPTIKTILDGGAADVITLSNIGSRTFPMIIDYLETHAAVDLSDVEKCNFDREFASGMDIDFIKKLIIDAYYLKLQGLQAVLAPKMADLMQIISATWKYKELYDRVQAPGWKERFVQTVLKMDWADVDVRQRRKEMEEMEELEEDQAENINIQ